VKSRKKAPARRTTKDARSVLVRAARDYAAALSRQHEASAAMNRAISRRPTVDKVVLAFERRHDVACDVLGAAEHELLVCAAVVGGWSRRSARRSV
jgi:hypothetical protein